MGLSRSSYYYRAKGQPEAKVEADADIRDRLEELALKFPRYGYRRMTAQLKREGHRANHKRVLRIMREARLLVKTRRSRRSTRCGWRISPTFEFDWVLCISP